MYVPTLQELREIGTHVGVATVRHRDEPQFLTAEQAARNALSDVVERGRATLSSYYSMTTYESRARERLDRAQRAVERYPDAASAKRELAAAQAAHKDAAVRLGVSSSSLEQVMPAIRAAQAKLAGRT